MLALLKLEGKPAPGKTKHGRVTWPDVEERARRILGKRVRPNLVLSERQGEAV